MDAAEVKEYTRRATDLRLEGRFEESVLAARKATALAPGDANAWWQLALSLSKTDGDEAALSSLSKVVELAPDFSDGWHALGRVHQIGARTDVAIACYERALEENSRNFPSMRMLAYMLKGSAEDGVAERRLTLLRTVFENDALNAEDTFDLAYLLAEAKETAEAVKVYEHYTRSNAGGAALYNLALNYRELGRDADALDALESALQIGYDTDNRKKVVAGRQQALLELRRQVLLGPQPYLDKENWFQHYINPFTLLNADPDELADNPKALQKAKQALLREIELEDGKVDWLPGLVIDKSLAMARLTELDNPDNWLVHEVVFRNRALNEFLMRGSLEHFLIKEDGSTEAILPHLLDAEILDRIGPTFAAQFDEVLVRAVEREDLTAVECLMDGRRWVTPAQQDACFESTRRLLTRLREPLMKLLTQESSHAFTFAEIEKAFDNGSLGGLLMHLPIEFYEAHSAVGTALRELAVSFYNRERDADVAKAILDMGRYCAQKSPALAHQIDADRKALDELIADEKASESHLVLGGKNIDITKAGVAYGTYKLAPADIIGLRWGMAQSSVQPPIYRLTVAFQARQGEDIVLSWSVSTISEEGKKLWEGMVDAAVRFIQGTVIEGLKTRIDSGDDVMVGPVAVDKAGVLLTAKGWFWDKQVLVPWTNLSSTLLHGVVTLSDATNRNAKAELLIESTYNALLLHTLINRKKGQSL